MKEGINESHSESSNSDHGANKKRKIHALTQDAHQSPQQETTLVEAQQKIAKLEEINKRYQNRLQNEFVDTVTHHPASLVTYLSGLKADGLLQELDWNRVIQKAPHVGMTALQILLQIACCEIDLLTYLNTDLFGEDQLKSFDFNASGAYGSAFYILLEAHSIHLDIVWALDDKIRFHYLISCSIRDLISKIVKMTPLENIKINDMKFFVCLLKKKIELPLYRDILKRILNEIPFHIDLDQDLLEMFADTKWKTHVDFILKLQEINQAVGERDAIENAEVPQKSVKQLIDEAEALAETAAKNGYSNAYYWLSKALQSIFYHNNPTMESLDTWKRVAKKIAKTHPEYNDIHRALADEYQTFLTEREKELITVPKINRSHEQQEELEALQQRKLITALRAAGRVKDADKQGKALYYRLGYMLVKGSDEIAVTEDPKYSEFEVKLDKIASSSKKDCVFLLNEFKNGYRLEKNNTTLLTAKTALEQKVAELMTQLAASTAQKKGM